MKSRFFPLLACLSALFSGFSIAKAQPAPPKTAPTIVATPKTPDFAASLAKAKKFKAARNYEAAKSALYDAMDADEDDARPSYYLGWIAIAEKRREGAIYNFRSALRDGLPPKEASEARAALKRLGATEAFPRPRRAPRSLWRDWQYRALTANLLRPSLPEWALGTALTLGVAAILWGIIALLISWAAQSKPGRFLGRYLAFWLGALFLLRVAGQFWISFAHILPLTMIYFGLQVGQFLAALGYGLRRLFTKKVMDKGGIVAWGSFWTLFALVIVTGTTPFAAYSIGAAIVGILSWLALNPWFIPAQRAEQLKNKGDIAGSIAMLEAVLQKPRLNAKSRFVMLNELASNYGLLGEHELAIERANAALEHVEAFQSAEVLPRVNLSDSLRALGRNDEATDQLAKVWHLTETGDCFLSGELWRGVVHGNLAELNYWRGWLDEAERQADLCIEAFPPEKRANQSTKNLVAASRAIKGAVKMAQGDLEAAHRYIAGAPKTGPKRVALAFVKFIASQVHEGSGQLEIAETLAREALEAAPTYFPAQLQLADLLAQRGQIAEAIQMVQEILPPNAGNVLAPLAIRKLQGWGGAVPALPARPEQIPLENSSATSLAILESESALFEPGASPLERTTV